MTLKMEIERLNSTDVHISGIPGKVYKKLGDVNDKIKSKLKIVEENFRKEVLRITDEHLAKETAYQQEIMHLKSHQTIVDDEASKRLRIQVEELKILLENNENAYKQKSAECEKYILEIDKRADQIHELQIKIELLDKRHQNCNESLRTRHKQEMDHCYESMRELELTITTLKKTIEELTNVGKSDQIHHLQEEINRMSIKFKQEIASHMDKYAQLKLSYQR